MNTREEIEMQYQLHCVKCWANGIKLPVPPPWMPDTYGRRAEVKRDAEEARARARRTEVAERKARRRNILTAAWYWVIGRRRDVR